MRSLLRMSVLLLELRRCLWLRLFLLGALGEPGNGGSYGGYTGPDPTHDSVAHFCFVGGICRQIGGNFFGEFVFCFIHGVDIPKYVAPVDVKEYLTTGHKSIEKEYFASAVPWQTKSPMPPKRHGVKI